MGTRCFPRWKPARENSVSSRGGLEEEEVVVVSHGDFLHYVSGVINQDGEQEGGWWKNTEVRSCRFWPVGHGDALMMEETPESVTMRNASGPGKELGSGPNAV